MRIILQKEVEKLGVPGDIVEVADGYARNFLMPRGMAAPASRGAIRHAEKLKTSHAGRVAKAAGAAQDLAGRMAATQIRIASRAGEDGKLFGSVTAQQVAEELAKGLGMEVDRRKVHLEEPIRSVGTHEVSVHLHPEVNATVTVEVVAEDA